MQLHQSSASCCSRLPRHRLPLNPVTHFTCVSMTRRAIAIAISVFRRPYSEVAVARFRMLPVLADFPVAAVPPSPRPNDSPLYNTIRTRVRKVGRCRLTPSNPC